MEALQILRQNEIHLVLMDIMMPQMDGIAATAKIREESNVPVILLTAKSEEDVYKRQAGLYDRGR